VRAGWRRSYLADDLRHEWKVALKLLTLSFSLLLAGSAAAQTPQPCRTRRLECPRRAATDDNPTSGWTMANARVSRHCRRRCDNGPEDSAIPLGRQEGQTAADRQSVTKYRVLGLVGGFLIGFAGFEWLTQYQDYRNELSHPRADAKCDGCGFFSRPL